MTPKEFLLSLGFREDAIKAKKYLPDGREASLEDILEMYREKLNDRKLTLPLDVQI